MISSLLNQIEACLNSRPLIAESSDLNDLNVLTPGHFLIVSPISATPTIDFTNIAINRLKHWQQVCKISRLFWHRWQTKYLHTLQQIYKWKQLKGKFKINNMVILKDENLAFMQWPLGRIVELLVVKINMCTSRVCKHGQKTNCKISSFPRKES